MLPYPVLLGDVGGTNARFAMLPSPEAPPITLPRLLTGDFADPVAAMAAALHAWPGPPPRAALLAVAARVEGPRIPLTNAGWVFDPAEIGARLGLGLVEVVNDYVPLAAALGGLAERDLVRLGAVPAAGGARLALGPGTGLGASALLPLGERALIHSTEAGHVEFGPTSPEEAELWCLAGAGQERVTAETLLSGPGLHRLARALARMRGEAMPYGAPNDVLVAAEAGEALGAAAVHLFARLLGRFAGDLALVFGATGGVFIAGGLAPRMIEALAAEFRPAFEHKAPFAELARRIPAAVVVHPHPALFGLARIAAAGDRFSYGASRWRG